jgi:hypothetical protein
MGHDDLGVLRYWIDGLSSEVEARIDDRLIRVVGFEIEKPSSGGFFFGRRGS